MIALSPEAEAQLDALIAHYEALGRIEASINLLNALEKARVRIAEKPEAGLTAPRPYPALAKAGRRWVIEGSYWISYSVATPPVISGVFYAMANIPNRLYLKGSRDMPLPPVQIPKAFDDALAVILKPSAQRISAGLLALVDAAFRGQHKSREEIFLDAVEGEIDANDRKLAALARLREIASDPNTEYQRMLAREASRYIAPDSFIMPALPIAGKIFRDSEYDETETPIWEMWVQLLARACDKDRVGEAHPSFPWIISQLSSDEAKLLKSFAPLQPRPQPFQEPIPVIATGVIGVMFPENLSLYLGHLGTLGLLMVPTGWEPTGHAVMVDHLRTYMLTDFGRSFISAVSRP